MSEAFFDRLAKGMSGGTTRRGALKTLGGLLAGGFLFGLTGRAKGEERIPRVCYEICEGCNRRRCGESDRCRDNHRRCLDACEDLLERDRDAVACGSCSRNRTRVFECDRDDVCVDGRCRERRET